MSGWNDLVVTFREIFEQVRSSETGSWKYFLFLFAAGAIGILVTFAISMSATWDEFKNIRFSEVVPVSEFDNEWKQVQSSLESVKEIQNQYDNLTEEPSVDSLLQEIRNNSSTDEESSDTTKNELPWSY